MEPRTGDEIVAAGQFFHTGTRVVLWMDPGGYDAYRVERRFGPIDQSHWNNLIAGSGALGTPNRYDLRQALLTPEETERVRGGGWDLPLLQRVVDQFVIHYDVCGTSRQCFKILQDSRDLSVHFMLDLDGTIYQTLDLKEQARHASIANPRSVGVEIANMGAYEAQAQAPLAEWYKRDTNGQVRINIPARFGDGGIRNKGFIGHPMRTEEVSGVIQGKALVQYDFTPQQYEALIRLTAALCRIFPRLKCDYPKDVNGRLIPQKLSDEELKNYHGVLGHYHIQTDKVDPGPALQWEYVISNARRLMNGQGASPVVGGSKGAVRLQ